MSGFFSLVMVNYPIYKASNITLDTFQNCHWRPFVSSILHCCRCRCSKFLPPQVSPLAPNPSSVFSVTKHLISSQYKKTFLPIHSSFRRNCLSFQHNRQKTFFLPLLRNNPNLTTLLSLLRC